MVKCTCHVYQTADIPAGSGRACHSRGLEIYAGGRGPARAKMDVGGGSLAMSARHHDVQGRAGPGPQVYVRAFRISGGELLR